MIPNAPPPLVPPLPAAVGVVVIGAGMAGLCAAIAAAGAGAGADVLVLDAAPPERLGGNARHGRNIRVASDAETPFQRGAYPVAEFGADLARLPGADPALAAVLANGSSDLADWLMAQGVRLEPWAEGNLPSSRRTVFLRGGGQAMVNALLRRAVALGVDIRAGVSLDALPPEVLAPAPDAPDAPLRLSVGGTVITAGAVVLACGGLGANGDWLRAHLGPAAAHLANRGTPEQLGAPILSALAQGAVAAGRAGDGHVVAVDARAPATDAGIVSRVDGMQWGIVVGADGRRIADEGAVTGPARHSVWARHLLARDDPRGWVVLGAGVPLPPMPHAPIRAAHVQALAARCGIDAGGLAATLAGPLVPPRSGDLAPLVPPFQAIPIVPGIAFTRFGLATDATARALRADGTAAARLFVAGTAMCGAVLGQGYLSGAGLTIAAVFGRIAGEQAAALLPARAAPPRPMPPRPMPPRPMPPRPMPPRPMPPRPMPPRPMPPRPVPAVPVMPPPMDAPPANILAEAQRALNLCNTCGFCTGLCAVFPDAQLRPDLRPADLRHLAHLCHDCGSCADDCQYAPPHPYAVSLPATLAALRLADTPAPGRWALGLYLACLLAPVLALLLAQPLAAVFGVTTGPGAFYALIPHPLMAGAAGAVLGGAALGLAARLGRFWWNSRGPVAPSWAAVWRGMVEAMTLRHLDDCETRAGPVAPGRRLAHHLLAGGFALTFLSTIAASLAHLAGQMAPYALLSPPVVLGTVGGGMMLVGLALMARRERDGARRGVVPKIAAMVRADRFARAQLWVLAASGLALLALRETPLMGVALALHLGSVAGAAVMLPFGKLAHGGFRLLALIQAAARGTAARSTAARSTAARSTAVDKRRGGDA